MAYGKSLELSKIQPTTKYLVEHGKDLRNRRQRRADAAQRRQVKIVWEKDDKTNEYKPKAIVRTGSNYYKRLIRENRVVERMKNREEQKKKKDNK